MRTFYVSMALLLLGSPALAAAAEGSVDVYRYLAGTYTERAALSNGGTCTMARFWSGAAWEDAPLVVGGVCAVPLEGASVVRIRVEDDAWTPTPEGILDAVPFRYHLWGGSGPGAACAQGATAWGEASVAVPSGCESVSVYLSDLATSGTITVARG